LETLTILYFVYLAYGCGRVGGKVSILDVARWMRVSKTTMKKQLDKMVEDGLLGKQEHWKNGRAYRWDYWLTDVGQAYLDNHSEAAYQAYRLHVAKTIAAIKRQEAPAEAVPMSKKNVAAENAGQKRMF
jgi:DNA-binding MarR family transcriptional regulator